MLQKRCKGNMIFRDGQTFFADFFIEICFTTLFVLPVWIKPCGNYLVINDVFKAFSLGRDSKKVKSAWDSQV